MGCTVRAAPRLMQSSLFQGRTSISYRFTFNCDLNQNTPLITTKPIYIPEKDAHLSICFNSISIRTLQNINNSESN